MALYLKREYTHELPTGIQGYAMNTRRPIFADPRVRQAITWAFDFEWTNKNLFYSAYKRTLSYFSNTPLAATGLPSPAELQLLEPFKDSLPEGLLTQPFTLPVTDGSGNNREQLLQALKLLQAAGWQVKDRKLIPTQRSARRVLDPAGRPQSGTRRAALCAELAQARLRRAGRTVDPAQYQHLTDDFDFDMTMMIYPGSDIPGANCAITGHALR